MRAVASEQSPCCLFDSEPCIPPSPIRTVMIDSLRESVPARVTVTAPARLHMGFLDPAGSLGRDFGSIGVALNEISTRCTLRRSATDALRPVHRACGRGEAIAAHCCKVFGFPESVEMDIERAIPEHVGLGSGTQLALAVGVGLQRLHGSARSVREIARAIGRGKRSGIGIAVFEQGGFIVDGGRGPATVTPPALARFEVPECWRFILVFDSRGQGLHGERELAAFRALPPFPGAEAARLCHLLLLQGLPALAEERLIEFGAVVTEIQRSVGDYFAPAQGGRFASSDVAECIAWLQAQGAHGIGQTSWGPTGFCLVASPEQAQQLAGAARRRFSDRSHISLVVASARNTGAAVQLENSAEAAARTPQQDMPSAPLHRSKDRRSRPAR